MWKDKEGSWDATFVKLIRPSLVAIFRLQILQSSKTSKYYVLSYHKENGALTPGTQSELTRLEVAKWTFMKQFQESTGLSWENRHGEPKAAESIFVSYLSMDEETRISYFESKICPDKDAAIGLIVRSVGHRKSLVKQMARRVLDGISAGTTDIHLAGKLEFRVGIALLRQLLDHPDLVDGRFSKSQSVMSLIGAYQSLALTPRSPFTGHRGWVERETDVVSYQQAVSSL